MTVTPQPFTMPLARILDVGNWEPLGKPAIRELYPGGTEEQLQQTIDKFYRLKRLVLLVLVSQPTTEIGFGRHLEGIEASENFRATVKAPSYDEMQALFYQMRQILIENPVNNCYTRIEFGTSEIRQERARFFKDVELTCRLAGRVIPPSG